MAGKGKARDGRITTLEQLETFSRSGVATGVQTWVETTTWVNDSGGSYRRISVGNESVGMMRAFLREAGGAEVEVKVENPGMGVVEGHSLSVVYAGVKGTDQGYAMGLVNHTTRRTAVISRRAEWLTPSSGGLKRFLLTGGKLLGAYVALSVLFILYWVGRMADPAGNSTDIASDFEAALNLWVWLGFGVLAWGLFRVFARKRQAKVLSRQIIERVEAANADLLRSGPPQ